MFIKPLMQPIPTTIFIIFFFFFISINLLSLSAALNDEEFSGYVGPVVKKDQRKSLVVTEFGEISVIKIVDGIRGPYHIQFITLEPNSLFLPVLLHADMVFYVHTGSGRLSWVDDEDLKTVDLKRGDIFRLQPGSVFYIECDLETQREKLRIYAIFANPDDEDLHLEPSIGVYSSISDLVRGFDKRTLQAAFKVPEDVIQSITNATERRVIVHAGPKKEENLWELEARYLKAFLGSIENKKKKKDKAYNIRHAKPDFKNCNGWSTTVTKKDSGLLKGSNIGIFMVNLTKGSMMGPHWNPKASEISIVLHGQGMVRVACPSGSSTDSSTKCKNMRFRVKQGDVFSVTRFHPMAQMSFNNDSFVFMGFSTATGRNHPQFLAGKSSVLRSLDRDVLALSFNVTNTTIDALLAPQGDSIILDCTSCAEEEERLMEEEIEKEKEEEAAREREEEEKKREEEEAREREEEEKKREEEKTREREEEKKRREEEEARKREEEEGGRGGKEEEARKGEEEEGRRRKEKEKRRREEEAEREQEGARKQEEERREKRRREEEGGGEEPGKQEEEAEREQEEARKQEQGKEKKRREEEGGGEEPGKQEAEAEAEREEEEARKQEQGKEKKRREEEGGEPGKQETEAEREQEEARRQEEERRKRRGEEEGGGEPWKEDAEARSEVQENERVKMYLKMWKG